MRRKTATLILAGRRAGWLRVSFEGLLALFCAFTTMVLYGIYAPTQDLTLLAGLALAGGLATLVAIPLRLLRPMSALVLGAALSLVSGGSSFAVVVLSFSAGYRARRQTPIIIGFGAVLAGCVLAMTLGSDQGPLFGLLAGLTLFASTAVLPAAVAAMIAQRRLLVMTMHQRNLELHQERLLVAESAQARERNRIAAELHDSLGHRLTLMSLYTGGLSQSLGSGSAVAVANPKTHEALDLLRDTSSQAMSELRQILKILHQDGQASGKSLSEVEEPVAAARATGTLVELARSGQARPLNLVVEHAGFRVVQEGLTNALRHAGGAPIRVEVRYAEDALFVEVRNRPGRPYEGTSTGQGLLGLTERVRLAGGVLSSGRTEDGDFRLGAMLPYDFEVPEPGADQQAGDFPSDIRRNNRRQRIGLVAVLAAVVVTALSGAGALVLANATEPVPQKVFDSFRPGDDEDRARELLPAISMRTSTGADGQICDVYLADLYTQPENGGEIRYEVCFRDGVVHSKREFEDRGE